MSKKSVIFAGLLLVAALSFGGLLIANFGNVKPIVASSQVDFKTTPPIQEANTQLKGLNDAFVEIAKSVTPTVAYIEVTSNKSEGAQDAPRGFEHFFQMPPDDSPNRGSGSGIIISKDGYIITNNHVVSGASETGIKVVLTDKREYTAKLIGTDPNTDLAVIKIDAEELPVATIGNSDDVQVGQWVVAIGNPLGLNSTVTAGIVSAIGRNINIGANSYAINNFIQTDAAINPGNSGGALVDINGTLVGINSAIKTTNGYYQGYGFAIPVNMAKNVASELIKNGKVSRGYIGVTIKDVDIKEAKGLGLDKAQGVLVQDVIANGAGADAGLRSGDVILTVDDKEVNAANELQTIIGSKHPGESVKLKIFRDGNYSTLDVTLKPREENNDMAAENTVPKEEKSFAGSQSFEALGFTAADLTSDERSKLSVVGGVKIVDVKTYSEGFDRGLRAGLVIVEADKQEINDTGDLSSILSSKSKGDIVVLKVKTPDNSTRLVALEVK